MDDGIFSVAWLAIVRFDCKEKKKKKARVDEGND